MSAHNYFAFIIVAFATVGCVSTSQVMPVGRGAFTVTATSDGLRSAVAARESALNAAAAQCEKTGKQINVTSETSERTRMNIDTTYTVNFRCD